MTRIAGLLLCGCAALLPGCSGQDAAAPLSASSTTRSTKPASNVIEPKIVVQLGHQVPVVAVRWVDQSRHLASLARDGSIVFWNVASGAILDHAQVPIEPQAFDDGGLSFHAFSEGTVSRPFAFTGRGAPVRPHAARAASPKLHAGRAGDGHHG